MYKLIGLRAQSQQEDLDEDPMDGEEDDVDHSDGADKAEVG